MDDLVALVREHGRLGYQKISALLRSTSGWVVNDKRAERIWLANVDSSHELTASSPIIGDFAQVGANMDYNSLRLAAGLQGSLTYKVSNRISVVGELNSHGSELGAGGRLRVEFEAELTTQPPTPMPPWPHSTNLRSDAGVVEW